MQIVRRETKGGDRPSFIKKIAEIKRELRFARRFFLSPGSLDFLNELLPIAEKSVLLLVTDQVLYRARKNGFDHSRAAYKTEAWQIEEMLPPLNPVTDGRAHPINIPVLYAASSRAAAVAEVRPVIRQPVSVISMRFKRELKLLNLTSPMDWLSYFEMAEPSEQISVELGLEFSRPISQEDEPIGYLFTQLISEFFRVNGFDGIVFPSQFRAIQKNDPADSAVNYAIFDKELAIPGDVEVFQAVEQKVIVESMPRINARVASK